MLIILYCHVKLLIQIFHTFLYNHIKVKMKYVYFYKYSCLLYIFQIISINIPNVKSNKQNIILCVSKYYNNFST